MRALGCDWSAVTLCSDAAESGTQRSDWSNEKRVLCYGDWSALSALRSDWPRGRAAGAACGGGWGAVVSGSG